MNILQKHELTSSEIGIKQIYSKKVHTLLSFAFLTSSNSLLTIHPNLQSRSYSFNSVQVSQCDRFLSSCVGYE